MAAGVAQIEGSRTEQLFTLYRFYAADDTLLYVGLTVNPGQRFVDHAHKKQWWSEVAQITLEQHPDHNALVAAERAAIATEKPIHNVIHNGRRPPRLIVHGFKVGEVYAFGLKNGCIVGQINEGDEEGVWVDQYAWRNGLFCDGEEWIAADSIVEWLNAELMPEAEKVAEGYCAADDVFVMDDLDEFQQRWVQ